MGVSRELSGEEMWWRGRCMLGLSFFHHLVTPGVDNTALKPGTFYCLLVFIVGLCEGVGCGGRLVALTRSMVYRRLPTMLRDLMDCEGDKGFQRRRPQRPTKDVLKAFCRLMFY
jgi:hypothetical protein